MADEDAKASFFNTLAEYGLPSSLGDRLWNDSKTQSPDELVNTLRGTPEYASRFPGMAALRDKGRAISESEYISMEKQYASLARYYELPPDFYDSPDDFGKLIAGEVSPKEYSDRVEGAAQAAFSTPPEVRDELSRLYGLGPGDMTAFWLDPDRGLQSIQKQMLAGQLAGTARRTTYGLLTREEAEKLAGAGVTATQAEKSFAELSALRPLFTATAGEAGEEIGRETQLAATFGQDAEAMRRIERRRQTREAQFGGAGGAAQGGRGVTGLGSAQQR